MQSQNQREDKLKIIGAGSNSIKETSSFSMQILNVRDLRKERGDRTQNVSEEETLEM